MPEFKEYGGGSGAVKAQYDMWLLEYGRLNDILQATSDYFMNVRGNPNLLIKMYEGLTEFYRILRPLLTKPQRVTKDKEMKQLKNIIFTEIKRLQILTNHNTTPAPVKEDVLSKADAFYHSLMDLRQVCGLGIRVSKNVTEKQRIKRTVRGGE